MSDTTTAPVMGDPGPDGRFGEFGGLFVPETLVPACQQLDAEFRAAWADPAFRAELDGLLRLRRPAVALNTCENLSAELGCRVLLKRGPQPHRLAQDQQRPRPGALARRMGKAPRRRDRRRPAWVATATAAALLGLECGLHG